MKKLILVSLIFLFSNPVLADETAKTKTLEERILQLEKRLATLEAATAPLVSKMAAEKKITQLRIKAKVRMREDSKIYSNMQLREIESLYQVANRKWRTEQGKQSLEKLIEKYDQANRTGCALLYLGQMSQGDQREKYLKKAIEDFSDCCYGNGVQVGAYSRLQLAFHYSKNNQKEKVADLFKQIASKFPDAIDHNGKPLADTIAEFTINKQRFDVQK